MIYSKAKSPLSKTSIKVYLSPRVESYYIILLNFSIR